MSVTIPRGKVSVLVSVKDGAPLSRFARPMAAMETRSFDAVGLSLPGELEPDATFAPIPFGRIRTAAQPVRESLMMLSAGRSERYLMRCFVDADRLRGFVDEMAGTDVAVFADPRIEPLPTCARTPPLGTAAAVARALGMDLLHSKRLDGRGVALAVVDTGINIGHLQGHGLVARFDAGNSGPSRAPGSAPVGHGTMVAYDALIAAPGATLLDFPILGTSSPPRAGSLMEGILSEALKAHEMLLALMLIDEARRPYKSLVVNNSWGLYHESWDFPAGSPGRYADNPDHPFNLMIGTLAGAGADILFAAGNCGADCPDDRCQGETAGTIMGANSHPAAMCVAGVDIRRARVGYSSQGPGRLEKHKPDFSAYTHFAGSEAFGSGVPDSGTSAACPVAAGAVAALRTDTPPSALAPAAMAETLRNTADPVGAGRGWNADTGNGIINPVAAKRAIRGTS